MVATLPPRLAPPVTPVTLVVGAQRVQPTLGTLTLEGFRALLVEVLRDLLAVTATTEETMAVDVHSTTCLDLPWPNPAPL